MNARTMLAARHRPRRRAALLAVVLTTLWGAYAQAQGATGPIWQRAVQLPDGRIYVTDGSLIVDAALAKPATMPAEILSGVTATIVEGYLSAPLDDEFGLRELGRGQQGDTGTYVAPSGVVLNAQYVDYLRGALPGGFRLRMKGDYEPVVILLDGSPVGLIMPMKR